MRNSKVFTLLFDIGRSSVDGRSIEKYLKWLHKSGSMFENLVVYHDGCLDSIEIQDCDIRKINKFDLIAFKQINEVRSVLTNMKPVALNDITFKLAEYSLTQYSKFELGKILIESDELESVLWVDAGISRFVSGDLKMEIFENQARSLVDSGFDSAFEIDIRNNLRLFPPRILNSEPGTSRRVISGTSFWFSKKFINEFSNLLLWQQRDWIRKGTWDNEQVMLRNVLPNQELKVKFIPQFFSETGGVARAFINEKVERNNILSNLINILI